MLSLEKGSFMDIQTEKLLLIEWLAGRQDIGTQSQPDITF